MIKDEVRRRRKKLGVSCRAFAIQNKINPATMQAIESGYIRNPGINVLKLIARGLGVAVDDLVGGKKNSA